MKEQRPVQPAEGAGDDLFIDLGGSGDMGFHFLQPFTTLYICICFSVCVTYNYKIIFKKDNLGERNA